MRRHALMGFVAAASFGLAAVTSAAAMNLNVGHGFTNNVGGTFGRDPIHRGGYGLGPSPGRGGPTTFGPGPSQSGSGGGWPPPLAPCPGNEHRDSNGFCVQGKPNFQ
jgi:hypothetical protein